MLNGLVERRVSNVAVNDGTRTLCLFAKLAKLGPCRTPEVHGHIL